MKQLSNNKKVYGFAFIAIVSVAIGFMGQNCGRMEATDAPSSVSLQSTAEPQIPIGLLSSEQMLKTLMSVTGTEGLGDLTDPADDLISRTYTERSGSLPSTQHISQATGPTLVAVTNLASVVCAKAVDRDIASGDAQRDSRLFFREFNFSQGLSGQNSDAVVGAFTRLARNAWRREPNSGEVDLMIRFSQEFATGANATAVAQTRLLAVSICTATVSTIDTLTF